MKIKTHLKAGSSDDFTCNKQYNQGYEHGCNDCKGRHHL